MLGYGIHPPDETTDVTTSHPTRLAKDANQVAGYNPTYKTSNMKKIIFHGTSIASQNYQNMQNL